MLQWNSRSIFKNWHEFKEFKTYDILLQLTNVLFLKNCCFKWNPIS